MAAQLKELIRGDLGVEGLERTTASHGPVFASTEWVAASVDKRFFVATRPLRVKAITACVTTAGTGGAATAIIRKVPSGTAIASGTALHAAGFDLVGVANTNDAAIALSTTVTDLDLATGDSLAIDFTGTLTSAAGSVTVGMAWR